jgi:hypothetical protein
LFSLGVSHKSHKVKSEEIYYVGNPPREWNGNMKNKKPPRFERLLV